MNHLMVSQLPILPDLETKWDHDAVHGIINGYCRRIYMRQLIRLAHI